MVIFLAMSGAALGGASSATQQLLVDPFPSSISGNQM
jgi:hypothetical protein